MQLHFDNWSIMGFYIRCCPRQSHSRPNDFSEYYSTAKLKAMLAHVCINSQRAHDIMTTLLSRQNDAATSFWRHNDVVITSCVRWEAKGLRQGHTWATHDTVLRSCAVFLVKRIYVYNRAKYGLATRNKCFIQTVNIVLNEHWMNIVNNEQQVLKT